MKQLRNEFDVFTTFDQFKRLLIKYNIQCDQNL